MRYFSPWGLPNPSDTCRDLGTEKMYGGIPKVTTFFSIESECPGDENMLALGDDHGAL